MQSRRLTQLIFIVYAEFTESGLPEAINRESSAGQASCTFFFNAQVMRLTASTDSSRWYKQSDIAAVMSREHVASRYNVSKLYVCTYGM